MRRVRRLLPRIAVEVLVRAELQRIDEDRRDDAVGAAPRLRDQRHVAGVERAHRRHQRDVSPARANATSAAPSASLHG